jgi:hypothetical protein
MQKVQVVNIEAAGYYASEHMSGNCIKVTLQRGGDFASCDGMLIWDEEYAEDCFDEWVECAVAGEVGYTAMLVEGDNTVLYTAG